MANTKQDFYDWVKIAYPGYWPEDMDTVNWTLPYQAEKIARWKQLGYPATAEKPVEEPFLAAETATTGKYKWAIPGQVLLDPTTGKYYYTGGDYSVPTTGIEELYTEITPEQVEDFRKQYIEQTTPDTLAREQFEWRKAEAARKAPSISEQQWTISQNRREWAPGVNIEQDITTGKLYRPGSMVEVSPDIANSELLNAQTGQIDWQKGATEADLAERRRQFDILQRQKAGEFEREQSLLPQRMALQWELDRQRLLAGLPSEDWVTRGILELELKYANPYKQQVGEGGGMAGDVASLGSQLDRQTGQVQALEQIVVSRGLATGWDSPETQAAKAEMEEAQERRDATYQAWSEVKKEAADWSPQPPPQRQKYPFAPEWLPQWASGQVAGREISPENVMTPSGQQLTQMPQSRASQLGYYADWTARMGKGRSWRDILGEAEIMQPLTPRGAGATRWSPARM